MRYGNSSRRKLKSNFRKHKRASSIESTNCRRYDTTAFLNCLKSCRKQRELDLDLFVVLIMLPCETQQQTKVCYATVSTTTRSRRCQTNSQRKANFSKSSSHVSCFIYYKTKRGKIRLLSPYAIKQTAQSFVRRQTMKSKAQ